MRKKLLSSVMAACLMGSVVSAANAGEVVRHKIPGSDFPIALAIEIPASATLVNLSGQVPDVVDAKAPSDSIKAYGDTETQTVSVLKSIEDILKSLGLTMGDVVKMQVFLVGDPGKGGKMDFAGFMKGYTQFFATKEQPNTPTRSVFQVAGLANPGWLVEIEVSAVRK
ncbi:RidA family protein [Ectopseudomonas oleovorans]|uniref:Putative endoribonuclease L-PSP n=1 Tax=Ectopseudomonas oleovorans (strain CECT 5344) TaxID=1182590 RepID=W6RAC3_ECTO5|nr:RidA family protein [Pseudomonas oleovorans]CDM38764.1 putative endoribonuclease L-PSP [Pseudomonas oleovorans CECT 5344]CDR89386.1 putative endoribonuclease L-PSP [Pseudomonas oleovorans]